MKKLRRIFKSKPYADSTTNCVQQVNAIEHNEQSMTYVGDFTAEWVMEQDGTVVDFKITQGDALYQLPWYRRIMMWLFGRSLWHHIKFNRGANLNEN